MINIPIGPQSFKRDFLNGQGHFNFDLPGGLKTGEAFAPTVTEVLNTGGSGERGDLTFGDPNGLAMSASVSGGGATKVELIWPQSQSEFGKAYGLTVPDGRVSARLHLEGQAGGTLSGGMPVLSGVANFEFGLKAGTNVAYDRVCQYDATMTSLALLQDLVSGLALPQRTGTPASLPKAGELFVFSYGGFLDLTAGLTAGYELMGHQGLTLRDLSTVVEYGLHLKASVNVGFKFGGNFEIASRLGADPNSVRLTVKKSRALQADFAAAFQADAIAAVNGLPGSADEFLSALLGADVRRSLEIFQKIRADADLDALQKDVDKILAKTLANVATKWIGRALDQTNLKPFQDIVGRVVDEYRGVDQRVVNAVVHLYQDNVDQGTVDRMTAALRKIIALNGREDLAKLEDADAWKILTRLGGNLTTLLSDDGALGQVQKLAQTALDFAEGRWQPKLRDLVNELKAQFHLDQVFDQVAKVATKDGLLSLTDVTLQGVIERLLGIAWEKIKTSDVAKAAAQLKAALDKIDEFKETWYAKLGEALHQQFSLTANYAFTRASANDALIDVEIDVSTPAGQKLFDTAVRGQFANVFDPANARLLRVHQGVLTHQLTDSAHLLINVLQWSETQLVEVIARTTNSIEVQPTGLVNVFTTEASVKQRVERKDYQIESTFLIGLAGDASQAAAMTRGKQDYLIETLRKIGVSYNLAVSDKVTTTAELTQYLELAEYLRVIPSASAMAAKLAAEFPKGLGAVTATYVAKYDSDAIFAAFSKTSSAPLKDIVRQASRYLVSAHLINSSNPLSDLVTMGFAYRDPGNAAVFDQQGFTGFRDANATVTIPAWFTKGAPRAVPLASGGFIRQQLITLYGLEHDISD
ncbi:MAG TPA: hypothetical protein VJN96_23380, partial [Vicinamibacterales bacterium]|nr:hypothetical protein [Vicinamibacterales bacterium]